MSTPTITDVVRRLAAEHDEQFVYRGQSHTHGVMLPSALRSAVRIVDGAGITLSRSGLVSGLTRRGVEQQRFREFLMHRLGPGIGALLAQQYGMTSNVIDITSSPDVAAFFATRRWPTYTPVESGTGRIYRWRKLDPHRTVEQTISDAAVGKVFPMDVDESQWAPAVARPVSQEGGKGRLPIDDQDSWFVFPTTIFTFAEINDAMSHMTADPETADHYHMLDDLGSTRWAAQQGGFLRPETRYPSYLGPAPDGGFRLHELPRFAEPVLNHEITVCQPDAVTDAAQIGPPEVFEFQHSVEVVDIDAHDLWPSVEHDPLFRYCALMAWGTSHDYFELTGCNTPWDFTSGLLDRGPYAFDQTKTFTSDQWVDVEADDFREWVVFKKTLDEYAAFLAPVVEEMKRLRQGDE